MAAFAGVIGGSRHALTARGRPAPAARLGACVEDTRKPNPDRARPCAWTWPSIRAELRIVANDTTGAAASRNWAVERAGLPNYDNSGEHARRSSTLRVRPAQPVLRAPPDLVAFLAGFFLAGAF